MKQIHVTLKHTSAVMLQLTISLVSYLQEFPNIYRNQSFKRKVTERVFYQMAVNEC